MGFRTVMVAGVVGAVAVAGCSSGSSSSSATGSGGPTTTAANLTLKAPVKIVLLAEKGGESAAAQPEFDNGAALAVADLNAAGGVGGQPVQYQQIKTPLVPAEAQVALNQGLDANPTGMIAFPSSGQAVALGKKVDAGGVPTIYLATDPALFTDGPSGSPWAFVIRPRNDGISAGEAAYAIDKLGVKKAGLICVNSPFGTTGCAAIKKVLDSKGVTIVSKQTNASTASDMTSQVRAMQGADVVFDQNFPNPLGVVANQLIDNGITAKHMDGASAGIAVRIKAIKNPQALANLYGVVDCEPTTATAPASQKFVTEYTQKYGNAPNYAAAEAYDAVMLFANGVRAAKSTDHAAVADAMRTQSYNGVCENYRPDRHQGLHHKSVIETFGPDGKANVVSKFDIPDPTA
jgi:branched-chain amino acid transport system substrate-binding protein